MLGFRYMGELKYSEELEKVEAHIGDCYYVLYDGKFTDPKPALVNCLYCYDGGWVAMGGEAQDNIEYIVETIINPSKFKCENVNFDTDTVVVLAEKNNTRSNLTILNIWPEILDTSEMKWRLLDDVYHICNRGKTFTAKSPEIASIEYNRRINEVFQKKQWEK